MAVVAQPRETGQPLAGWPSLPISALHRIILSSAPSSRPPRLELCVSFRRATARPARKRRDLETRSGVARRARWLWTEARPGSTNNFAAKLHAFVANGGAEAAHLILSLAAKRTRTTSRFVGQGDVPPAGHRSGCRSITTLFDKRVAALSRSSPTVVPPRPADARRRAGWRIALESASTSWTGRTLDGWCAAQLRTPIRGARLPSLPACRRRR
jgi:hypothetical protein